MVSLLAVKTSLNMRIQQYLAAALLALNLLVVVWYGAEDGCLKDQEEEDELFETSFTSAVGIPNLNRLKLSEDQELVRKGARLVQKYFHETQLRQCLQGKQVQVLSLPSHHNYGLFSQIGGIAQSLLTAAAHGYVLSWSKFSTMYANAVQCPSRSMECFFRPITTCDQFPHLQYSRRERVRNSCVFEYPRRRINEHPFNYSEPDNPWSDELIKLRNITGVHKLGRPDLFNPHFFGREALRFVMRPNARLLKLTSSLLKHDLKPLPNWEPLKFLSSRVAIHIRAGKDKSQHTGVLGPDYYLNILNELPLPVDQVLFSTDSRQVHEILEANLSGVPPPNPETRICNVSSPIPGKRVSYISQERFGGVDTIKQNNGDVDTGLLLIAQSFVFASADTFVGFLNSNVGQTVHMLMGCIRFTSFVPVFDAGGSPMPACHQFTEYPLRPMRHLDMIIH